MLARMPVLSAGFMAVNKLATNFVCHRSMTIHAPIATTSGSTPVPSSEISEIVTWLVGAFGTEASLWAEVAVASLCREGSYDKAEAWNAVCEMTRDADVLATAS